LIEINLIVPDLMKDQIANKESDTFRIISSFVSRNGNILSRYYAVETTEEEATFLALKFGPKNVWKR
jgi:hypothetical protein